MSGLPCSGLHVPSSIHLYSRQCIKMICCLIPRYNLVPVSFSLSWAVNDPSRAGKFGTSCSLLPTTGMRTDTASQRWAKNSDNSHKAHDNGWERLRARRAKTVNDGTVFACTLHTDGRNLPGESRPTIQYLTTWWSSQLAFSSLHSSTLATPGMDHSLKVSLLVGDLKRD